METAPPAVHTDKYIFRSPLPDITISHNLTLPDYIFERASLYAHKPCIIEHSTGKLYSYAEVHLLSCRIAAALSRIGVRRGDVVMLLLPNCAEFVTVFLGIVMCGATATTANPLYKPTEIHRQVYESNSSLIFTMAVYVEKLAQECACRLGIITVDERIDGFRHLLDILGSEDLQAGSKKDAESNDFQHFSNIDVSETVTCEENTTVIDEQNNNFRQRVVVSEARKGPDKLNLPSADFPPHSTSMTSDDVVALPFSSGTTGLPKGVMLTHKSLITSIAQQVDGENPNLYIATNDVVLCVLPLIHIFSLNSVLLCALRAGAAVVMMQRFEVMNMLQLIEKHMITVMAVVPPIVLAITKCPAAHQFNLSSVRKVLSGAAPMGKELEEALRVYLPQNVVIGQGYGMTEAGPVLAMCMSFAKYPRPVKAGSCGTVVRNAEMKIIDTETGASLGRNKPGEICIRGNQVMKGYLNNPDATANAIDQDGWLHTGDVGYVDDDGEVFIVDRVKEIIKYNGFQVPPAELESMLIGHPDILDAAVVPEQDDSGGEIPAAFVVRASGSNISEEEIKSYIAKEVVFYKRIRKVYFTEAIPKTSTGKILRRELKTALLGFKGNV